MSKRYWSAAVLAAVLGVGPAPRGLAKPPDLPVDHRHQCPEGRESVGPAAPAEEVARPGSDFSPVSAADAPRLMEARHLFEVAERCRRKGDVAKARTCYEEVHLMCPTSRYGRLAIDRLQELEQASIDATEEQDAPPALPSEAEPPLGAAPDKATPPAERLHRKIHDETQPLGLVERVY